MACNQKEVLQYDLNHNLINSFPSIAMASKSTGTSEGSIRTCCNKLRNQSKGYIWEFKDQNNITEYHGSYAICDNCGKEFACQNWRINKRELLFCSKKCESEYKRSQTKNNCTCAWCGREFHLKPSNIKKANYCSIECLAKSKQEGMRGLNNHQFGLKGNKNASWKSDEKLSAYGYKLIRCLNHPFKNCDDFVFEHRLVAEKYLLDSRNYVEIKGRKYLSPEFHVHHLDFNKLNNEKSNLFVLPKGLHISFHNKIRKMLKHEKGRSTTKTDITYQREKLKELFYQFIDEKHIV